MSPGVRPGHAGIFILGLIAGVLLLVGLRLAGQPPLRNVHYHANWAVFVHGARLDLRGDRYMEDVAACTADPTQQRPEDRVHMHEGIQDIVHVHDAGATWGHLLDNLGMGLGEDILETDEGVYTSGTEGTLKFVLNGRSVRSIENQPVGDEDRLLISFGSESPEEVLASQFPHVAETAGMYNTMPDPASCSGAIEESFGDRLRRAVWY